MNKPGRSFGSRFTAFWWSDRGLSTLLLILLLALIFSPLLEGIAGSLLSTTFLSLLLLSGVATISGRWHLQAGAGVVALAGIILEWLKHVYPGSIPLLIANSSVTLLYFLLLTLVVMGHVFKAGPVTSDRVQGAIAAYILVAVTWSVIYRLIELCHPGAFNLTGSVVGASAEAREAEFTYFSFVTLTTLGYGDITPVYPVARIFVIIEALIGQLFPATLLARLVSLSVTEPKKEQ